jgi:anti-anti-sigma factor
MRERIYGERRVVERVSDDLDAQRALAPEGFAITMRHEAGATVLALLGELDLAAAPRVRDALDRIEQERPAHLVIDLSRLCFIDSSGIHLIVDAHRRLLAGRRSTLEIRPGSPAVQRIFQLTGLEEELPFADGG